MRAKFKYIVKAAQDQSLVKGLTHRFYTYPAGFSPKFVSAAIENLTKKGDLVLDPFMGGGTSIVEAMKLGRKAVGVDLNYISFFVSKVKTTVLKSKQMKFIKIWVDELDNKLKKKIILNRFTKKALSLINYKGLGKKEIYRLKLVISSCSIFLKNLKKVKNKKINNFLKLLILRSMQSSLHNKRPISAFETFRQKIKSNCLDMLYGMNELGANIKNYGKYKAGYNSTLYHKCASKSLSNKNLKNKKTKLIITSPPYPGIHIPYGNWQIHGRRNTSLPYFILGRIHPVNRSTLTFQYHGTKTLNIYFATLKKIYSSLYKASNKKTLLIQLVAFNKLDGVFERYLKTMEKCGFEEIKLNGKKRVWRNVPRRSWQARHVKGDIPSKKEVLLLHKPNGKVSIN